MPYCTVAPDAYFWTKEVWMRKLVALHDAPRPHWVGDGFPVRPMFSPQTHGSAVSPFILLDYAQP